MAVHYQQQWMFPSRSNPRKHYTVSLTMDNRLICHCWPYLHNRDEDCEHIRRVREEGHFLEFNSRRVAPAPIRNTIQPAPEPARPVNGISIWDNGLSSALDK